MPKTAIKTLRPTPLGKTISLERLQRLLGDKTLERLEVAALREEAQGIIPVTRDEIIGALRWINGDSPKAESATGRRQRYSDRVAAGKLALKYFTELSPNARIHFIKTLDDLALELTPPRRKAAKRGA